MYIPTPTNASSPAYFVNRRIDKQICFKTKPVFILHQVDCKKGGFLRHSIRGAQSSIPEAFLGEEELSLSALLSSYTSIFNIIMFDRIEALGS